ncbi:MAG TPA: hypothetical protein VMV18_12935, partial [bacterium]|nr:hypothetical protein [bacterium]
RAALAARDGTPERALASVALARARVTMLFELFERSPDLAAVAENRLQPDALRSELRAAIDTTRTAVTQAVARANTAELRDLTDLGARVNAASDMLERTIARFSDDIPTEERPSLLQESSGPARFERPAPVAAPASAADAGAAPPPRVRVVPLVLVSVVALAIAGAAGAWLSSLRSERERDPALTAVATHPAAEVEGVRFRTIFVAGDGTRVAIADGSWFRIPPASRDGTSRAIARKLAENDSQKRRTEIRDYRARKLAVVGTGGTLTIYEAPYVSGASSNAFR